MKSHIVLVLGMHRSGTSCLTGSLQAAGLFLGEVFTANPHNQKGNRENARVMKLNTAVMHHSGGDWNCPPDAIIWTEEHRKERDAIIETMEQKQLTPWGIKDPRFIFTLPFWLETLVKPTLVGSFRHPSSVAASLEARDGYSHETSVALWTEYNTRLLEYLDESTFPLVCFDVDPKKYFSDVKRLCQNLHLNCAENSNSFFDSELRSHHSSHHDSKLDQDAQDIYERLMLHYRNQCVQGDCL